MATLEDKILGDTRQCYCSDSEGSDLEDESESSNLSVPQEPTQEPPPEVNKWDGTSQNTGPKGVIKDWQIFRDLAREKRAQQETATLDLAKKLTLTVQSTLDEEKEKAALEDPELAELLNDDFLLQYQKQRMQELLQQMDSKTKFKELMFLNSGDDYLNVVDETDKLVTVIIHIYEERIQACQLMNQCLQELAEIYQSTKFCAIQGSKAGVSKHFKVKGLPALLVYKNKILIGNFVKLTDDLGNNFCSEDVQELLVEHGLLEDLTYAPPIIKHGEASSSDSD